MQSLAPQKLCTGCLACKDACPHNAINIILKNGITHVTIDNQMCVECKVCEKVCPILSPIQKNKAKEMCAYGGWVKDDEIRKQTASGGAFAGLALNFLSTFSNGIVVGASLQDNKVKHIAISSTDELQLLLNSKYVQSNTNGIYKVVYGYLKEGRKVLFSGLPCQIAGLYGYLRNKKIERGNIWTIELICHGVASQEAIDLHLKYYKADSIERFRNKASVEQYGTSQCTVLKIKGEETVIDRKSDIFYNIFSSWLLDRRSCSNCQFAKVERVADITIGDFWGKEEAHTKGVSIILANNEHALSLVKDSEYLHIFNATKKEAFESNPNLWTGWKAIQWHPIVMWPDWFRKHLSEEARLNILTRRNKPCFLLWGIYKVLTNLHLQIDKRRVYRQYKDLLIP